MKLHRFTTPSGQLVRFQYRDGAGGSAPLAVYLHGRNGTADDRADTSWLTTLNDAGWVVAGGEVHGNHWGGPAAVRGLSELVAVAGRFTAAPVLLLIGGSMGALAALNWIRFGGRRVDGAYLVQPCCGLTDRWENDDDHRPEIEASYASPTGPVTEERLRRWDPLRADPTDFTAARYRFVSSDGDRLIRPGRHARPMAALLAAAGPRENSTLEVSGDHGDPSHFDPADLAAFADRCRAVRPPAPSRS